ncbi:oxygen-independent coproporphyrinogen-3 oxidase [Parafrankia irregularis]|uniref:Heme chaperone HemW n=1 Tax=Parafrankia irregularis TaxID=795642 RepID=A0A0S4QV34_9ACTN|nr:MULTISPECIES: coproporphyrinogen-III oxidase family protein [Parafrankia]MBE3201584.1 coproporphyrinogen III oxidase family protein [Parafrankia sp. CH37]CUU59341.1 oxygen-independent coproporphyrinogen-3 oxidase [Parafrankia irregularis]
MTLTEHEERTDPYPRKCYLPFILYPPGMHRTTGGKEWLESHIDMHQDGGDFVLYIGVPFCRTRCKSCPYFASLLPENDSRGREERYVDALVRDLRHWASYRKFGTGRIRTIFIGGGTGSILRTSSLRRLVDTVHELFEVADDAEFTLEGNARDFDDEKIEYVAQSKINRLSLGVQSFQPEILGVIGSPHAAEDSARVIRAFQARGFRNIQLDLMYNMPGHTLDIWKRDLETLATLDVPHFTIYLYRIHRDTIQDKLISRGRLSAPKDPEGPMVKAMYREAVEIAEQMGYTMYMVDHFCKPGYENMYNHWNWKVYIDTLAVGPGSYSYFDGYRLGTETDVEKYIDAVESGDFLISTITDELSPRVERERYVVFALLYYEIEYSFYRDKFGTSFLEDFTDELARLERKGLVELTDDRMRLTQLGLIWHTNVILEFFNPSFWNDSDSLNEPNWSLNGVMVEVGAHSREYWLGDRGVTFFPAAPDADPTLATA